MDNQAQYIAQYCAQNNSQFIDNIINSCCPTYTEFKEKRDCMCCNPENCETTLICNQAWMSSCEAHLFCEATSRLSYELCRAKNLCDVKQIIDIINCLFSASALKENALAEVIKSYSMLKCKKCYNYDCCCNQHCDCNCK